MLKKWGSSLMLLVLIAAGLSFLMPKDAVGEGNATGSIAAAAAQTELASRSTTFTAYIHTLNQADGTVSLSVDPIGWYQGEAADTVFKQEDPEGYAELGGAPDGYYIVNRSEDNVVYPVSPDAAVLMQLYDRDGHPENADIQPNEAITLSKFIQVFNQGGLLDPAMFPYHITVKDGKVVKIVQQYTP
ncbi:hypothetical protein AWM70_20475 [Paenibacillus yonginensis]|uniref:Uncharacterized protein n=1 Tax=Paenibacillus yonginensis TaxID=1462996 RepID=A0A1B1N5E9_9BACL|nr:hypothetical protein [Paenibacillus yonginensis]ANS76660.1 hypothetical protein AWM70_20475 [Paenibacillus yonginensis]